MSTKSLAPTHAKAAARWRTVCQSHLRTHNIKRAAMGGGESVPFEQALSNLAHAYLKDRAPQLLDYELGFQLLEKNEDNDRAVGVFGFKVGQQLLYGPVFFLNGELKGHELLYLKDSDTFVPMKENWINYVLGRKPNVIGDEVPMQPELLGVDRPNMDQFRESPRNKYGSAHPDWLREGLPGLMYALGRLSNPDPAMPTLMKTSASMATRFLELLDLCPTLAKPVCECYGSDIIKTAIDTAKTVDSVCPIEVTRKPRKYTTGSVVQEKTAAAYDPVRASDLKIYVHGQHVPRTMTQPQLEKLARDGVLIEDTRKEAATAFMMKRAVDEDKDLTLMNPDDTGIYQVLCKPDSMQKCLYIHAAASARGAKCGGVLVRLDEGDKAWTVVHPSKIYVEEEYDPEGYRNWFDDQSNASLTKGGLYTIVCKNGQGTGVFEVLKTAPGSGDEKCYEVRWIQRYGYYRPDNMPPVDERREEYDEGPDTIVMGKIKGTRVVNRLNATLIPDGAKAIKIKSPPEDDDCCDVCVGGNGVATSSDPPALEPGSHVDLQMGIYKMSEAMTVFNNGTEAIINATHMTPKAALISLVKDTGLREKVAREILKQAQLKRGLKFRVKTAQGPEGLLGGGPTAPAFPPSEQGTDWLMGSGVPTQEYQEQEYPVEGLQGLTQRPLSAPQAEPMMQNIMQAAQTGQKEVLDTSMLSNLLKGSQNDTLIDKHLPDLMKGVDSLGRLLFNLYWHHDKFEERYGSNNLPDLEDAMRNAFENMGDVTLELKQQTIEPYPDEGVDGNFGEGEN